jgi:hypothetical protein
VSTEREREQIGFKYTFDVFLWKCLNKCRVNLTAFEQKNLFQGLVLVKLIGGKRFVDGT